MMKKTTLFFTAFMYLMLSACTSGPTKAPEEPQETEPIVTTTSAEPNALEGTWRLISAKLAHTGKGEQQDFSDDSEVIYYKIFTKKRFLAFRYNNESRLFKGASGGTYIQLEDEFREYIEMQSWDSTLIDVPQTFTCSFSGDTLIQEGTLKGGTNPDAELREVYLRVEPAISGLAVRHPVHGVWLMDRWANGDVETPMSLAPGVQACKIITPNFFTWIRWRKTGGVIDFVFGSQKATSDYYSETIISFPDKPTIGKEFTYDWDVADNQFTQKGFVDSENFMDFKIEEYYLRDE